MSPSQNKKEASLNPEPSIVVRGTQPVVKNTNDQSLAPNFDRKEVPNEKVLGTHSDKLDRILDAVTKVPATEQTSIMLTELLAAVKDQSNQIVELQKAIGSQANQLNQLQNTIGALNNVPKPTAGPTP